MYRDREGRQRARVEAAATARSSRPTRLRSTTTTNERTAARVGPRRSAGACCRLARRASPARRASWRQRYSSTTARRPTRSESTSSRLTSTSSPLRDHLAAASVRGPRANQGDHSR